MSEKINTNPSSQMPPMPGDTQYPNTVYVDGDAYTQEATDTAFVGPSSRRHAIDPDGEVRERTVIKAMHPTPGSPDRPAVPEGRVAEPSSGPVSPARAAVDAALAAEGHRVIHY